MRKKILLSLFLVVIICTVSQAQKKSVTYFTGSTEFIFGFASIDNDGDDGGNVMRFSGFLHLQGNLNHDFSKSFGVFTGLSLRNVGFIYNEQSTGLKKKYRTYNVGIPFGFKLGSMNRALLFAGYEIEFPTNYKEKTYQNEVKQDKFNVWFTKRVPTIYNTVFVGIQFKYGLGLKFKYYLTNFFNQSYTEVNSNGVEIQPYKNIDVRVFYFSVTFQLFKNSHFNYSKEELQRM
jgi:hypothetical protein